MVIDMDESRLRTIAQIQAFLDGSDEIGFSPHAGDEERYAHISRVLKRFDYPRRKRSERGVLLAYLRRTSDYSRAQLTRLIERWTNNRLAAIPLAKRYATPSAPFARKYTAADIALLVQMDRATEQACGAAVAHLFKRAFVVYADQQYERLATVSVSHLYNLRQSIGYTTLRAHFVKTHPVCNPIGVRRAPSPNGWAGYVRIDSVHQGDYDGRKGVYHITCVDAVSQWQVEASVEGISETFLLPVLQSVIAQFPFVIKGFHSDNGSEYINGRVAKLLEKLRIEQTKSRSRHSNDNALAESKNNSVVRKHMGYSHIPRHFAEPINVFYQNTFNPWLNLHRPCLFPVSITNVKGKVVKRYPPKNVMTPLEALSVLAALGRVKFKAGQSVSALQKISLQQTDLQATEAMQREKLALFASFAKPKRRA